MRKVQEKSVRTSVILIRASALKDRKDIKKQRIVFWCLFLCSGWQKEGRQEQPLIEYIYIMDWNVEKWRTQIPFTRIVLYGKEPGREIFQRSGRKNVSVK